MFGRHDYARLDIRHIGLTWQYGCKVENELRRGMTDKSQIRVFTTRQFGRNIDIEFVVDIVHNQKVIFVINAVRIVCSISSGKAAIDIAIAAQQQLSLSLLAAAIALLPHLLVLAVATVEEHQIEVHQREPDIIPQQFGTETMHAEDTSGTVHHRELPRETSQEQHRSH